MSNTIFKGVVQLSKEQFEELKTNGRLTANGEDLIYNPNAVLYVTDMFIYVPSKLSEFEDYKEVIDNVTSTSTTNPLSANQGKLLNDKITSVLEKVNGKVQSFTVQNIEDLMTLFGLNTDEVKDSYKVETSVITYKEKSYSLKDGDMFLIVNTEVPDYWFSLSDMTLYKMETAKVDLSNYAQKDEIPTKVSELDNDSNFATEEYVNTNGGKIDTISVNGETQTITNKNVDITIPTKVSEIENDKKYATEDYVNTNGGKIDTISLNGVEQTITDKNVNLEINYYKVENKKSSIDLNTIVDPGNYGIASNCTNKPGNLSGTLYVGNYLDTTYAQQTFVDSEGKTWVRTSTSVDNSTWTTWDQLAKIKDIPTDLSKFENAADGVVDNQYATKKYVKDYVVDITASELEGYVSGLNYYSEDVFNVTTDPTGEPNKSYDYYSMDYDKNMAIQPIIGEEAEIPYKRESSSSHHPLITDCTYDMIWDTENPNKISFKYTGPTDVEVNNGNVAVTVFGDNFFYPAVSVLPLESNSSYYVKITSVTTNGEGQTQNRHFGLLYLSCGYSNEPMEEGNNGRLYFVSGRDTYRGKYLPRRKTNEFLLNTGPEANSFLMLDTLLPKINGWTYTYTFEIRKAESDLNKILENKGYVTTDGISDFITKDVNNLTNYTLTTDLGQTVELSVDSSTYVMTANLKKEDGTVLSTSSVDLPLESMVVSAEYLTDTKEIQLTLQNGSTTKFSVADLVSGLATSQELANVEAKIPTDYVPNTDPVYEEMSKHYSRTLNMADLSFDYNNWWSSIRTYYPMLDNGQDPYENFYYNSFESRIYPYASCIILEKGKTYSMAFDTRLNAYPTIASSGNSLESNGFFFREIKFTGRHVFTPTSGLISSLVQIVPINPYFQITTDTNVKHFEMSFVAEYNMILESMEFHFHVPNVSVAMNPGGPIYTGKFVFNEGSTPMTYKESHGRLAYTSQIPNMNAYISTGVNMETKRGSLELKNTSDGVSLFVNSARLYADTDSNLRISSPSSKTITFRPGGHSVSTYGVKMGIEGIIPETNNSISLGNSSYKFKNLYLSNGIYNSSSSLINLPSSAGTLALTKDIKVTSVNGQTGDVTIQEPDVSDKLTGTKYNTSSSSNTYCSYNAAENKNSFYHMSFHNNSDSYGFAWTKFANISDGTAVNGVSSTRTPSECTNNGFYYVTSSTNSLSGADANPFLQYHTSNNDFRILTTAYSDTWLQQIATDFRSPYVYIRRREKGEWKDWKIVGDVTTDTTQTISGVKTFSNGVKVGSANITYDSTNKCVKFTFD